MKNTSKHIDDDIAISDINLDFDTVKNKTLFKALPLMNDIRFSMIENTNMLLLPNINESHHIVTRKAINTYDFIKRILNNYDIIELYIAIYRIGKETILDLENYILNKKIKNVTILINDGIEKFKPEIFVILQNNKLFNLKIINNHTKIILAKTKDNYYIVEGSGNLSNNARIEQYCFVNSKELYNFHKTWINEING